MIDWEAILTAAHSTMIECQRLSRKLETYVGH